MKTFEASPLLRAASTAVLLQWRCPPRHPGAESTLQANFPFPLAGSRSTLMTNYPPETLLKGTPAPKPHSITLGPDGYLWVTTHNKRLMQVNPDDPGAQDNKETAGQLSAGIVMVPEGGNVIWYASPAHEQDYDPIYEWDVVKCGEIGQHKLDDDARAQTLTWAVLTKEVKKLSATIDGSGEYLDEVPYAWSPSVVPDPGENYNTPIYYVFFAEPVHRRVGFVKVGDPGQPSTHQLPNGDEFDTWLWSVAVSVDKTVNNYTYWATGQVSTTGNFLRKKNGLYTFTPGQSGKPWQRIPLPDPDPNQNSQVPIHVITDSTAVWVGTRNPNRVCRYDISDGSWTSSKTLDHEPRQLAFGPDGNIWAAAAGAIYCFKKDLGVSTLPSPDLDKGSEAEGLFVDAEKKQLWFTDPAKCSIGQYAIKVATAAAELVEIKEGAATTAGKNKVVDIPMIAQYVIDGHDTPGIPITCSIDKASGATFVQGSGGLVRVVHTNQRGVALFPKITTGTKDVTLIMQYSAAEKAVSKTLTVKS
ncbi:hypothetical protein GCM10010519_10090 [Streptomyces lactacystinicus]